MKITEGLFDNMVMQRTPRGLCSQSVKGESTIAGHVFYRVKKGKRFFNGKDWLRAGRSNNGTWTAHIKDLPTGGPYNIELKIQSNGLQAESKAVTNVLIGDVWVLAGQSNMQGCGYLLEKIDPVENVRCFYMNDTWDVASDPLHNTFEAIDEVHRNLMGINPSKRDTAKGAASGLHFGRKMFEKTKVPQGLIACAHGGTSMEQWSPGKKKQGSKSLYGALLRRVNKNGGKIAGIVWYQGCSDAVEQYHAGYTKAMVKLVESIRNDLRSPRLPFVMAQISRQAGLLSRNIASWNSIQEQQRRLPEQISRLAVIGTIDLTLDDGVHLDENSQIRVGYRLARAAISIRDSSGKKVKTIDFKKVQVLKDANGTFANLKVSFINVIGELVSDGNRAEGFYLVDRNNNRRDAIYKTVLRENDVILKTNIPIAEVGNYLLFYGFGCNPYCNITDTQDCPVPVFGPVLLGLPKLMTDFVKQFHVSKMFFANESPDRPDLNDTEFKWQKTDFEDFCNIHDKFVKHQGRNVRCYFGCRIVCQKRLNLDVHLGYDGPVKLWINGKEVFSNREGPNPANTDDSIVPYKFSKGEHQLIISLDSNHGSAYGIFLRFERIGISSIKTIAQCQDSDWPVIKM